MDSSGPECVAWLGAAAAEAGLQAIVKEIPSPEQLPELIRTAQAEGIDTIVAVGGDGTVRTVAQHLVGTPLRLGILPQGTANNVAHALGIPFRLEDALRVLATGHELQIDVGRIGTEYFLESAGVGLFADALQAQGKEELRRHEILRLLKTVLPITWNPRARRLRLTLDGNVQDEDAILVAVSNGRYLGESWALSPEASLEDGLFDIVIVGAMSRWELLRFGIELLRGRHLELPKVKWVQAHTVEI